MNNPNCSPKYCTKAIVYANPPDWTEADGGALKIYPHSQGLESCPDDAPGLSWADGNIKGHGALGWGPYGKRVHRFFFCWVGKVVFWFSDPCFCWLCLAM